MDENLGLVGINVRSDGQHAQLGLLDELMHSQVPDRCRGRIESCRVRRVFDSRAIELQISRLVVENGSPRFDARMIMVEARIADCHIGIHAAIGDEPAVCG